MKVRVYIDGREIGEHPEGSRHEGVIGHLVIEEPDGTFVTYPPGTWHWAGYVHAGSPKEG